MTCQKWPLNWLFLLSIYKHKGIKHAHKKREWLYLFFYMDKGPAAESRRRQRGEGWSQTADDVQAERASSPSCHMDRSQACYLSSTDSEMSPAWQLRRNRKGRAMSISVQGFSRIIKEGGNDSCMFQVLTLLQYVHFRGFFTWPTLSYCIFHSIHLTAVFITYFVDKDFIYRISLYEALLRIKLQVLKIRSTMTIPKCHLHINASVRTI